MNRVSQKIMRTWAELGTRFLPFADVATEDVPLSRLLRLSLIQVSVGMSLVLLVGTLNRVMIVELSVPASIVGVMITIPVLFAPFRALIGYCSPGTPTGVSRKLPAIHLVAGTAALFTPHHGRVGILLRQITLPLIMENVLKTIAVILALILAVMLFGADTVKGGIGLVGAIAACLLVITCAFKIVGAGVDFVRKEVAENKRQGAPWRALYLIYPAIIANILVGALAVVNADWSQSGAFRTSLEAIPYWWLPITLMFVGWFLEWLENAPNWLPKIPGAIIDFLNRWAFTFVAPVTYPRKRWTEIETQGLPGQPVGKLRATGSLLWSFLSGCVQFIVGGTLMGIIVFYIVEAVGSISR